MGSRLRSGRVVLVHAGILYVVFPVARNSLRVTGKRFFPYDLDLNEAHRKGENPRQNSTKHLSLRAMKILLICMEQPQRTCVIRKILGSA